MQSQAFDVKIYIILLKIYRRFDLCKPLMILGHLQCSYKQSQSNNKNIKVIIKIARSI